MAEDGRRFSLPDFLTRLAEYGRRLSLPDFLIRLAEYGRRFSLPDFLTRLAEYDRRFSLPDFLTRLAEYGRRLSLPDFLTRLAEYGRRFSLPDFLTWLAEYGSKLSVFAFTSGLIYQLIELCGFLFIHLTTASGNTTDGEPPSLKIPTHFYITIFKSLLPPSLISPLLSSCEVATRITLAAADDKQTAATISLYLNFFDLLTHNLLALVVDLPLTHHPT